MNDSENSPLRTCDIVMKGGITSGVVYPKAIVALARRYRFVNLGGTSAGAIAAAAAAAAEYRRSVHGSLEGFAQIDTLGDELASKPAGSKQTRLFLLFQPNSGTRRLFAVLSSALGKKKAAAVVALLGSMFTHYAGAAFLGGLPGLLLALVSAFQAPQAGLGLLWMVIGCLLALFGSIIAAASVVALSLIRELPRNSFGLCPGMPDAATRPAPAEPLTPWLTSYLNQVAGLEPGGDPLTFGHLWGPNRNPDSKGPRERLVSLEMMTTNLTHGRPYHLPFRDDDDLRENYLFYFREDEFRRLFPASVVNWMIAHPRPIHEPDPKELARRQRLREERRLAGYHPLPSPENLPVVVVTRMSLSFPFLLSAIPLHAIDRNKPKQHQVLERCWFTDGGLCSNMPLHFFDASIPRRPTFSIDLTQKPDDTPLENLVPEMDPDNRPEITDRWNRFDLVVSADLSRPPVEKPALGKLTGFIFTMISTMQNWNDAMQSRLPGYRDRIVRIPLTSAQGGLNLNMPPELVQFLTRQGERSAQTLLQHFDPEDPAAEEVMNWENHRWIRLRAMLAALEKMIGQTLHTCDKPESNDAGYEDWLRELLTDTTGKYQNLSYKPTKRQLQAALDTIERFRELSATWSEAGTAADGSPRPRPVMRPRPQV
ncbi:MAG: patatin-like phospholipase family protein [Prosthecobacter sp.]|jgi:predicted acylesterase/phospholipase RssA|uniref:patatin-like phospholipase family protein n=1 Tax=Prosthecobacter sp. TaxID=1965333 RepID=UPI001A030138|nr:patatin-like phospholipase family protein [Prosthecobacter sp.]MBE2286972.1 patatin-like phospholipase family protein [Prosthecobacter sp.]